MTSLFLGHGSPTHAFGENRFSQKWKELGKLLPSPKTILVISAHWLSDGTKITTDESLKTIHDFRGFPESFYQFHYPASGNPELAKHLIENVEEIQGESYGLDHGAWALLKYLYPEANIPVLQLSLDASLSLQEHWKLAEMIKKQLPPDTLVLGSGNVVHNLGRMSWEEDTASCWAVKFEESVKRAILQGDKKSLLELPYDNPQGGPRALPTLEHYLPLLYVMAGTQGIPTFPVEGVVHKSVSMLSTLIS